MKNFIDHEKLDSEGFKNLKKPGEELFIDSLSREESNTTSLKLVKSAHFQFVVLERRQPYFVLRIEIAPNFPAFKVEELKTINFDGRQRKFKNNTGVYLQNFLQYYAKFMFLSLMGFDSPSAYDAVKGVQTFLNKEGFKDGKGEELAVDGVVGANTANAVMGYQRAKGLTVDGIVGDETWNSIYKDKKKSESFFGEERKSSRRTTDDNGIPNMPEMDTYTPKSERSEDHFTKVVDKWKKMGNPFNGLEKSDDESFHDKVRRRWGNGGNPSRVLSLSRDNTPGISTSPFRTYKPKGIAFDDYAFSEDESEFSGSNRMTDIPESEYLPEDKIFATEEPEATLMSNVGSKESGESEAEEKEEELGIIKPGYNAKGEWSEDPDADNYGKDSAKYKVISKLDIMCVKANDQNRKVITSFCNDFRKFDENLICRVYYLNDKDGANNFGHTGVLLVNSAGQGLLFSYGAATDKFIYGSSRMNVGVYTPNEVWGILRGKETTVLSTKGFNTSEQYERWVYYDVSTDEGKDMFETAAKALYEPENYAVFWNNCDQVVDEIFDAGGEHVTSMIWPNATYEKEKFQDNVKEISRDIKKYSLKLYNKLRSIWE